jgi:hypothetical protein
MIGGGDGAGIFDKLDPDSHKNRPAPISVRKLLIFNG